MSTTDDRSNQLQPQQPPKKGPRVMAAIFILGLTGFLAALFWINWPKPRTRPEPLSSELTTIIQNMPGNSDAIIYLGLKDIRQSRFWNEAIPDSLKNFSFFKPDTKIGTLLKKREIDPSRDLDTLLLSFQRSGKKQQKFIGMAWGSIPGKLPARVLKAASMETADIAGHRSYALDSTLWVCPLNSRKMVLASSRRMLEGYFNPAGKFLERDSVSASLIGRTAYKSHLWFTLASPLWTTGALQSLTSTNSDVKSVGNLNRIQHLALSLKFGDGLKGHSEWRYATRSAAFFASSFLWGTITLSSGQGTRTSEPAKAFLKRLNVQQNLESVIITADIPLSGFKKTINGN